MKIREIQAILRAITSSGMQEVEIETADFKIRAKRKRESMEVKGTPITTIQPTAVLPQSTLSNATEVLDTTQETEKSKKANDSDSKYITLKSPMIGTFYKAPNVDADPFVAVGDTVKVGSTICVIEAMKLFNEIEAENAGKIVKILVENATPVEFGQPLFLVEPA